MSEQTVKRYDPFGYDGLSAMMHEDAQGDWVRSEDYDALQSRLDAADEWATGATMQLEKRDAEIVRLRQQLAERDAVLRDAARWMRGVSGHYGAQNTFADRIEALLSSAEPVKEEPRKWPKERDVGRYGDMSQSAHIRVGLDGDSDAYISVYDEEGGASVEFCTQYSGGGKSPKTREALIALMLAIEEDNAAHPDFDWWKRRAPAEPAKGGDGGTV